MKKIKIVALAAGVLFLAGCGNKATQNNQTDTGADKAGASKTEEKGAVSSVISSIKDAMASGKAMQCTYSMADEKGGKSSVTTYVDGKKYMTTMEVAEQTQHMIFDEEAVYSWSEGQKTGMKMTTACSEELAANVPKGQDMDAPTPAITDAEETFDEAMDVKCEPNSGADFSLPQNVTFTDQCEMLKNVMKNIPNMPAGALTNMPQL